jgi:hypothetical protein
LKKRLCTKTIGGTLVEEGVNALAHKNRKNTNVYDVLDAKSKMIHQIRHKIMNPDNYLIKDSKVDNQYKMTSNI